MIIKSRTAKTVHNRGLIIGPGMRVIPSCGGLLVTGSTGQDGYYDLHRGFTSAQLDQIAENIGRAYFLSLSANGETVLAVTTD